MWVPLVSTRAGRFGNLAAHRPTEVVGCCSLWRR
jgi:hypothetical protein